MLPSKAPGPQKADEPAVVPISRPDVEQAVPEVRTGAPLPGISGKPKAPRTLHFDAREHIVLRMDCMSDRAVKTVIFFVWFLMAFSVAMLVAIIVAQSTKPSNFFFSTPSLYVLNTVVGSILLVLAVTILGQFLWRLYRSNLSGKRWTHRRRRLALFAGVEVSLQVCNSLLFVIPNSYLLAKPCGWFSPLIVWTAVARWTIWNTVFLMYIIEAHSYTPAPINSRWYCDRGEERGSPVVMDAPLWLHWRKLIFWMLTEGFVLALSITVQQHFGDINDRIASNPGTCRSYPYSCVTWGPAIALSVCITVCVALYAFFYLWWILHAFHNLMRLPYNEFKQPNFVIRAQMRQRIISIGIFFLCQICYTFVGISTCRSYVLTWLGYLPSMMVIVSSGAAMGFAMTPKEPNEASILSEWLQEFAWTEGEEERQKREERASSLPPLSQGAAALDQEPLFCLETALKAMYFCFLVYDHLENPDSAYSTDAALALYDLAHLDVHWDKEPLDTKAIVGWGGADRVVIAFRGTASMANVKADLQVWRKAWPPGHGSDLLCTTPMVHGGFYNAWTARGYNQRIVEWLRGVMQSARSDQESNNGCRQLQVLVTGHSLGGALATMCAFDLSRHFQAGEIKLQCYTFGAPRTGNHAFARLYNNAVPDTWHLINAEDVVTRAGKFWGLYKRPGHRVLVNKLGDLVVRPSYVETAVRHSPGATSVKDHLLTSYQSAMASVIGVQFSSKRFPAGEEAVMRLSQRAGVDRVLGVLGLAHDTLGVLQEHGWEAFVDLRRRTKRHARRLTPPWRRKQNGGNLLQDVVTEPASATPAVGHVSEQRPSQAVPARPAAAGGLQRATKAGLEVVRRVTASAVPSTSPFGPVGALDARGADHSGSPLEAAAEEKEMAEQEEEAKVLDSPA